MQSGLTKKQREFMEGSKGRVNILEGAIRSGKTVVALLRWFLFVARAPRGGELLMIGKTLPVIWRNQLGPMMNPAMFGPFAKHVVGSPGANQVKIFGRTVHLIGANDAKAERVIRGMTVAGAFVDEVTVLPEDVWTQLYGRMSVKGAKIFATTNPDGPAHWFKRGWLDRIDAEVDGLKGWTRWSFTIDDNPTLDPEFVASVKAGYTGLFYRRFIMGEWCSAEGQIFDFWGDGSKYIIPFNDVPEITQMFTCGIDYGTTHPSSAIILGLGEPEPGVKKLYLLNEWRYAATEKTYRMDDHTMANEIIKWLDGPLLPPHRERGMKPREIHLDPAAASLEVMFKRKGVRNLRNADNSVLYGIRTMASLFTSGQLLVTDKCPGFISEIPGYSWDSAAAAKGIDKPVKQGDDSIDPARYAITSTQSKWYKLLAA